MERKQERSYCKPTVRHGITVILWTRRVLAALERSTAWNANLYVPGCVVGGRVIRRLKIPSPAFSSPWVVEPSSYIWNGFPLEADPSGRYELKMTFVISGRPSSSATRRRNVKSCESLPNLTVSAACMIEATGAWFPRKMAIGRRRVLLRKSLIPTATTSNEK